MEPPRTTQARLSASIRSIVTRVVGLYEAATRDRPADPSPDRVERYLTSGGFHRRSS